MQSTNPTNLIQPGNTVGNALLSLLRHPIENLLRQWNWKSAVLSAVMRGMLFFFANLSAGIAAALAAMAIESVFYIVVAGFYGAVTQTFRRAQPHWLATLVIMVLMPAFNHTLEFALHWAGGTRKLIGSIIASICFSMISACFHLFAMRRGAFIVGAERQTLVEDFRQLPRILFDFLTCVPRAIRKEL
ncbi:MAG: hypothetical protein ABIU20_10090 [Blastocatellia bacterium]